MALALAAVIGVVGLLLRSFRDGHVGSVAIDPQTVARFPEDRGTHCHRVRSLGAFGISASVVPVADLCSHVATGRRGRLDFVSLTKIPASCDGRWILLMEHGRGLHARTGGNVFGRRRDVHGAVGEVG
jgi:hypothetical protein